MPQAIIHTIGTAIYFVFFLLFLWAQRIPGNHRGVGWWAAGVGFAFTARMMLIALLAWSGGAPLSVLYSMLILIEKYCLLMGMARFFDRLLPVRALLVALLLAEFWVVGCAALGASSFVRGLGAGLANAGLLLYAAWVAYTCRHRVTRHWLIVFTVVCIALAVHWTAAFPIIRVAPSWAQYGFLLGTVLVLAQYFCLLVLVFARTHQRLLEAKSKAMDLAFQDPLTGLNNQRYMQALFEDALLLANRSHQVTAILFIDLDHFKQVNDRGGHRVGDEVLKTVAERLRHVTRGTDICARLGGDEFAVVCPQLADADQARRVAEKLLEFLSEPYWVDGTAYQIGASIGISLYPSHAETLQGLLELADKAMYQIKRDGKHGYAMHGDAATC
ncbi:MAG: diguanylate cyclase [Thermomonas sp.]|uniref:GGDEF domain-containing protein n=1 Tax=Thermomonas sp. TaxID=1971895 RepID=UPI0026348C33|nr:GGDEF domain-containing protein [Thermomonas sp.]MCC7095999.1 diguanylate cyclase [Thermomonas sp.]